MHIVIDMDNTLADTTTAGVDWLNRMDMIGHHIPVHDAPAYAFFQAFGLDEDMYVALYFAHGEDLHWHTQPYPDAPAVVQALHQHHRISVVTARPPCFHDISARWLDHHHIPFHALHCERDKLTWCRENHVDLIIEDAAHFAREFPAAGHPIILYDQPYNSHIHHPLITRVHHWRHIHHHLLDPDPS